VAVMVRRQCHPANVDRCWQLSQASGCAEEWVRRACTLVVAGVAAYASYQHQRAFARKEGLIRSAV
jgi:hypothetical protein